MRLTCYTPAVDHLLKGPTIMMLVIKVSVVLFLGVLGVVEVVGTVGIVGVDDVTGDVGG